MTTIITTTATSTKVRTTIGTAKMIIIIYTDNHICSMTMPVRLSQYVLIG